MRVYEGDYSMDGEIERLETGRSEIIGGLPALWEFTNAQEARAVKVMVMSTASSTLATWGTWGMMRL